MAVASVQVVLTRTSGLSPWKGGGFGMFATTDGLAFRHVRLTVDAPGRSEQLIISPSLQETAARASLFMVVQAALAVLLSPPHALSRSAPTAKGTARREIRMSFTGCPSKDVSRRLSSPTRRTLGTGGDSTFGGR